MRPAQTQGYQSLYRTIFSLQINCFQHIIFLRVLLHLPIVLTDVGEDGNTAYYRDENDVHYVPKRSLEELLIN